MRTKTVESLELEYRRNIDVVNCVQNIQNIQGKLDILFRFKPYLAIMDKKTQYQNIRENLKKLDDEIKAKQEEMEKIERSLKTSEKVLERLNADEKTIKTAEEEKKQKLDENEAETVQQDILKKEKEIRNLEKAIRNKEEDIKTRETKLQAMKEELIKEDEEGKREKLTQDEAKLCKLHRDCTIQDDQIGFLSSDMSCQQRMLDHYLNKKKEMEKDEFKLLMLLRNETEDSYNAVKMLPNFQSRGKMYRPVMLDMKLRDSSYAKFVETIIGWKYLEAFYAEDVDDINDFVNATMAKKLNEVSVFHLHEQSQNEPPRTLAYMLDKHPSKKHLIGFISDMFECPEPIKRFLVNKFRLNEIPVFSEDMTIEMVKNSNLFKSFFVGEVDLVRIRESRYTPGEFSTQYSDIGRARHFLTDDQENSQEYINNEGHIAELTEKVDDFKAKMKTEEIKMTKLRQNLQNKEGEVKRMKAKLLEIEEFKREIISEENVLKEDKKGMDSDSDEMKRNKKTLQEEVKEKTVELVNCLETFEEVTGQYLEVEFELRKIREKVKIQQGQVKAINAVKAIHEGEFKDLKKCQAEKTKEKKKLSTQIQIDYNKLDWKDKKNSFAFPDQIVKAMEQYANDPRSLTMNELAAKITLSNREAQQEKSKFSSDKRQLAEQLIEKCNRNNKELEGMKKEMTQAVQMEKADTDTLKKRVEGLVDKVDRKFKRLMAELNYAGSVELTGQNNQQGEEQLEESQIGLSIKVAFGGSDDLQPLNARTQSGGEKSVSTALYMMALQELTKVPFRCVDEINQGMDQKNEKAVWGLLLRTAKSYSAQYIYVSPKFPRNLDFDDVTVVMCMNGTVGVPQSGQMSSVDSYIESLG